MTIQFNCPQCNALIAFEDQHAGKRARCLTCQQRLVIPAESNMAVEKAAPEQTEEDLPKPGFYRAALCESWILFFRWGSLPGLVFVVAAVCFKFFSSHLDFSADASSTFRIQAPVGLIVSVTAWGGLFWYYLEIISNTVMDIDELPEVSLDSFFDLIWQALKSVSLFAFILVVALLPGIGWMLLEKAIQIPIPLVRSLLIYLGLFFFPMFLLTVGVGHEVDVFLHPLTILRPIRRALGPYLLIVGMLIGTWQIQLLSRDYGDLQGAGHGQFGLHLGLQIGTQILAILTMRAMGLYHRHFGCYLTQ